MANLKVSSLLVLLCPILIGTAPAAPSYLTPYINAGRFDPGDYQWLRGAFSGANTAEIATYQAMESWRRRCRTSDMAETREELAALGVKAGVSLDTIPYRSLVCSQAATLPEPLNVSDWNAFARDVSIVRPLVQAFLTAVTYGEKTALARALDLRDELNGRVVGEQMLRAGLDWAGGSSTGDSLTKNLTSQQRGILVSELAIAMKERDHANTAWLKDIVARQGWPKRSQVGDRAARRAWLLVQHADANPAFQVMALRLIEPLAVIGEANRRDYAYLYDRVMLKIVGKQRYGTQLICRDGRLEPSPLENSRTVDSLRQSVGLEALADAVSRSLRESGPCQSAR